MNKDQLITISDTEQIDIYDVACKTGLKSSKISQILH